MYANCPVIRLVVSSYPLCFFILVSLQGKAYVFRDSNEDNHQ